MWWGEQVSYVIHNVLLEWVLWYDFCLNGNWDLAIGGYILRIMGSAFLHSGLYLLLAEVWAHGRSVLKFLYIIAISISPLRKGWDFYICNPTFFSPKNYFVRFDMIFHTIFFFFFDRFTSLRITSTTKRMWTAHQSAWFPRAVWGLYLMDLLTGCMKVKSICMNNKKAILVCVCV